MTTPRKMPPRRQKGVPNKLTLAAKEAFEFAFDELGGAEGLAAWARRNKTMFYRLFARLIPLSVNVANTVHLLSYAEERARELSSDAADDTADDPGSAPSSTLP
jgi:hypothetical protein